RDTPEEPPKSCCGLLELKPGSLRWFITLTAAAQYAACRWERFRSNETCHFASSNSVIIDGQRTHATNTSWRTNGPSPPPTYRSYAGSLLRAPLSSRRDASQSEYSFPPSYRSQTSSTRPAAIDFKQTLLYTVGNTL
ncbi:hypothetical protein RN001_014346, partial [Aquatica leii]